MSRIAIVTDAASNQTNGVVRTNQEMIERLGKQGHELCVVTLDPNRFHFGALWYPEIKLQFFQGRRLARALDAFRPHYIHIVTEGPLGLAARHYCLKRGHAFTTAFHTNYAIYMPPRVEALFRACGLPRVLCHRLGSVAGGITSHYLRWFHAPSSAVMVATQSLKKELQDAGYPHLADWSRGVDTAQFKPYGKDLASFADLPRPIHIVHGRIAVEKSLEDFLSLDLIGSKVVIGDGPALPELRRKFPAAHFLGMLKGQTLARHLSAADIFVMPSRSETFGLVVLEALACGLPVAAYDVPVNREILNGPSSQGFARLNNELRQAVRDIQELLDKGGFDAAAAQNYVAEHFSWDAATQQFYTNLRKNVPAFPRKLYQLMKFVRQIKLLPSGTILKWRAKCF